MPKKAIFDKKNVLVIGGAGFVGSHICDHLIKTSKVICIDNFSTGDEKNIDHLLIYPDFEFIRHDISKPINLESFTELIKFKIEFQGIQEIYNLACPTSPRTFLDDRMDIINANSIGLKNILDLAIKYDARFMHFSSSVVYGPRPKDNRKMEETELGAVNFLSERSSYDEGKRFAETMVTNYRDIFNLDTRIMRLFRVYGPRMKLNDGHMFPDLVDNALEGKDLVILGNKDFFSSFCYVSDVVDATEKLMNSNIQDPVNIGSDVDVKLGDFAQKIIDLTESNSKIVFTEKEELFITSLCLPDITRARNELGWLPVVTLEKGLRSAIDHLRASKGLRSFENFV